MHLSYFGGYELIQIGFV